MSQLLVEAIVDGTFPNDEDVLSSGLEGSLIPAFLEELRSTKQTLSKSITDISSNEAADVDGWLTQAKKVQGDIAKCKEDARQIIQEHERLQSRRTADNEAQAKVSLLEDEIAFNDSLRDQIELISKTSQALNKADTQIQNRDFMVASLGLPPVRAEIGKVQGQDAQNLLLAMFDNISQQLVEKLQQEADKCFVVDSQPDSIVLQLREQGSAETTFNFEHILNSLDRMGALNLAQQRITEHVVKIILSHLHPRSRKKLASAHMHANQITIALLPAVTAEQVTETINGLFSFLQETLPAKVGEHMIQQIAAKVLPLLVENWLTPAIPLDLHDLNGLAPLRSRTKDLATTLQKSNSTSVDPLLSWLDSIASTWLGKRRMASLDAVRGAFKNANGSTRAVERVEKQLITTGADTSHPATDDEWNDNWGDDDADAKDTGDDASDAWGFDTDDQEDTQQKDAAADTADDEGDAWGWGEDDETPAKTSMMPKKQKPLPNGTDVVKQEEIVLKEQYTITDIPDFILEQLGKDNSDTQVLLSAPQDYFAQGTNLSELKTLPALILSMYRAIAPTTYASGSSNLPMLSPMNLYNDALYLSQRISEHPELAQNFSPEIDLLIKFARLTYTNELSTQRQILSDLLDNAQGFVDCTREPNTTVCENAVSSTVDYLRSLHKQWSSILSPSHTSQSIGSLLSSVMGKMIKDIEDMEDISEAQSQKLLGYMEQISKVEDLFMATNIAQNDAVTTVALHAPSYLRFQYLQQILDSSLVDIKYLWTDAGLRLEFSADEVIDLIKALFADSTHRRGAINAIRS